jgi:hypothetical protein
MVNVVAGVTSFITITVRPCGMIEIKASGRRGDNSIVPGTIWYSLRPEGGPEPSATPLPLSGPKVLTVGKYHLRVQMQGCASYDDDLEIFAGETIARTSIVLLCP